MENARGKRKSERFLAREKENKEVDKRSRFHDCLTVGTVTDTSNLLLGLKIFYF
jgi:hypothetical protein